MFRFAVICLLLAVSARAAGGEVEVAAKVAQAKKVLEPRLVTFKGDHSAGDFFAILAKQTGNVVGDRRAQNNPTALTLDSDKTPFWPALDRFCQLAGCSYTAYGAEAGVALIDGARRSPHVSYHGITRTALKRITIAGDLETGSTSCVLHLDVAWEPRFQPFYLGVGPVTAQFVPRGVAKELKVQAPDRGTLPVAGRSASEVEIQLPAPPRQSPAIATLEGTFKFIGPSKMLTFHFPTLKTDAALEQEEVSVRLAKVKEGLDRWLVEVQIDNPEGTPGFESFQTWLDNNRISLVKGDGKSARTLKPEPNETVFLETNRKALIQYAFPAPAQGKLSEWSLVYRTPGRIVELVVPYKFENVPLP